MLLLSKQNKYNQATLLTKRIIFADGTLKHPVWQIFVLLERALIEFLATNQAGMSVVYVLEKNWVSRAMQKNNESARPKQIYIL